MLPVSCLAHVLVGFSVATRLEVVPTVVMVTAAATLAASMFAAHTPPSGGSIRGLHEVPSNVGAWVER